VPLVILLSLLSLIILKFFPSINYLFVFSERTGNLVFDEMSVTNNRGSPNTRVPHKTLVLSVTGFVRNAIPVVSDILMFGVRRRIRSEV
jgi:hypothetical protein